MIVNLFTDPPEQTINAAWFISLFGDLWRWIFKFLSNTYMNVGNGVRFSFLSLFIAIFVFGIVSVVVLNVARSFVSDTRSDKEMIESGVRRRQISEQSKKVYKQSRKGR